MSCVFCKLLDPAQSLHCAFCGGGKESGFVSCFACSRRCPDPDCHGTPRWVKEPDEELCRHCAAFVHRLDAPCRNRPGSCDLEICETARNATGKLLDCFGPTLERDGYFVYQLETGYIGMTYNPSRCQFEHDRSESLWRYIDGRNDIENPGAYFRKAFDDDIEERWEKHFQDHWSGVRSSDKNAFGERRIRWLSPALPTRNEAYRCEWALKQYRNEVNGLFPGTFGEVVSLSSVPVVIFQSAGLDYDANAEQVSFDLSRDLPHELGPSQVVPVSRYELQRYDVVRAEYITVASGLGADFRSRLGASLIAHWRARAVNFDDIPGPWTDFALSEHDVALGVQKLVRVADVTAELLNIWPCEVNVRWSVSNPVAGVQYQVERKSSEGRRVVTDVGYATEYCETCVVGEATTYQYSVRAVLDGVGGVWQSGGEQSRCVVGGVAPGKIDSVSAQCLPDGSIRVEWEVPEWQGYDAIQGYNVETVCDGGLPEYAGVRTANSWYDADSKMGYLSDVSYRVRPWSAMGCGPWSEVIHVTGTARASAIRWALPSSKPPKVTGPGNDRISFQWNDWGGNGLSYDLETTTGADTICHYSTESTIIMPVDWLSVGLLSYRSRPVRRGIRGDWSELMGIQSGKDYESARKLPWPEGINVGLVVVDAEHGSPSVVAVWSGRDKGFLARGVPDFRSATIGAGVGSEQRRVRSVLVRRPLFCTGLTGYGQCREVG